MICCNKLLIFETYLLDKGLIHALTIHAEPTLSALLVDKDLFAVASEDSQETQTAGKCRTFCSKILYTYI